MKSSQRPGVIFILSILDSSLLFSLSYYSHAVSSMSTETSNPAPWFLSSLPPLPLIIHLTSTIQFQGHILDLITLKKLHYLWHLQESHCLNTASSIQLQFPQSRNSATSSSHLIYCSPIISYSSLMSLLPSLPSLDPIVYLWNHFHVNTFTTMVRILILRLRPAAMSSIFALQHLNDPGEKHTAMLWQTLLVFIKIWFFLLSFLNTRMSTHPSLHAVGRGMSSELRAEVMMCHYGAKSVKSLCHFQVSLALSCQPWKLCV